jgi:predicted small integral membrane protein
VLALGTLPAAAAVIVGLNGLYLLLAAFNNITDPDTNFAFVRHVLANGLDPAFRNSVLALAGLILIHMPSDYWRRPDTAPRDIG